MKKIFLILVCVLMISSFVIMASCSPDDIINEEKSKSRPAWRFGKEDHLGFFEGF